MVISRPRTYWSATPRRRSVSSRPKQERNGADHGEARARDGHAGGIGADREATRPPWSAPLPSIWRLLRRKLAHVLFAGRPPGGRSRPAAGSDRRNALLHLRGAIPVLEAHPAHHRRRPGPRRNVLAGEWRRRSLPHALARLHRRRVSAA